MGVDSKRFTGPQDSVDYRLFAQPTNFQTKRLVKLYCYLSFNLSSVGSRPQHGQVIEIQCSALSSQGVFNCAKVTWRHNTLKQTKKSQYSSPETRKIETNKNPKRLVAMPGFLFWVRSRQFLGRILGVFAKNLRVTPN